MRVTPHSFTYQSPQAPPPRDSGGGGWKKVAGPLAMAGVLILKFFGQIKLFLLPALKFLPVILKSGGSMFVTIGVYAMLWGWKWAVGFVLLIFVHELGHLIVARKYGLKASAPMFIPFMGAFILLKDAPKNAYMEADVGIGGPIYGSAAAALCHAMGLWLNQPLLVAIAHSGYFLNLFNLTPIGQLDGGRIVSALSPKLWIVGLGIMIWMAIARPGFIIWMILILSLPRVFSLFRKRTDEEQRYYEVAPALRMKMAGMYFGLIGLLAWQMHAAEQWLGR